MTTARRLVGTGLLTLALLATAACRDGGGDTAPATSVGPPSPTAAATPTTVERPRGGAARVGVWAAPDPDAPALGGAAVRALVLPQLFVAAPDGTWAPSLVAPGSDRTGAGSRSASFRLRPGAAWSDGTPITADDLRRTADARFVAGIDGPDGAGDVTVRFVSPLPGWRRLWSGVDSIAAPGPGIWGGPFVVAAVTPGLETVLRRNPRWYAGPGPFLDEVRLVLVPDPVTMRQLLERGELDVAMPLAGTNRIPQLRAAPGLRVDAGPSPAGGWWLALRLNPLRLDEDVRGALAATVDRDRFAGTLLRGEAAVVESFDGAATWSSVGAGDAGPLGHTGPVLVTGAVEDPMTTLLQRAMQKRAKAAGGTLELRNAEMDRVDGWVRAGEYAAALSLEYDGPTPCWTCRWDALDADLARAADAGDRAAAAKLESRLRDEAVLLPLWRPRPAVAVRGDLKGPQPNAYGLSPAWNAAEWWRG